MKLSTVTFAVAFVLLCAGSSVTASLFALAWFIHRRWEHTLTADSGQDIAEYAVMLAVVLVIVIGIVKLIGLNAANVFSQVGNALSGK